MDKLHECNHTEARNNEITLGSADWTRGQTRRMNHSNLFILKVKTITEYAVLETRGLIQVQK
jgi:hypothetical protein